MDMEFNFPPQPEKPLASDCCGNGCVPCVLDIYQEELDLWKEECDRIRQGNHPGFPDSQQGNEISEGSSHVSPMSRLEKVGYNGFIIQAISQETHNSVRVRFHLLKSQSLGLSVGQHVIIRASSSNGSYITRQYTPISPVEAEGYFEFVFKLYPSGQMSRNIMSWKKGDKVDMRGPVGNFVYRMNKYRKVLMLCAGTGIAPMCQVIHSILDNEEDETFIRLLYACRDYKEILLKKELSEWRRFWNFSSSYILSQEPENPNYSYGYGEEIIRGHIDETYLSSELGDCTKGTMLLICGTRSFDSDMLTYSRKLGVSEQFIHKF